MEYSSFCILEYSSFCILNNVLYMCTSDLSSLFAYLKSKGLDIDKADQGRIHHTSPDDFLIICSSSVEKIVRRHLSDLLKGELHFRVYVGVSYNSIIDKTEYILISDTEYLSVDVLKEEKLDNIIIEEDKDHNFH